MEIQNKIDEILDLILEQIKNYPKDSISQTIFFKITMVRS
jgi:hypothetical protein